MSRLRALFVTPLALPLASAAPLPAEPWRAVPAVPGARLEPGDGPLALTVDGTTWAAGRRDALAIGDGRTGRVTVVPAPVGLYGFSHGPGGCSRNRCGPTASMSAGRA